MPDRTLDEWKTELSEGRCLYFDMDFSKIGAFIIENDGEWYATDNKGRVLTPIDEEKLEALTITEHSEVTSHPKYTFPYDGNLEIPQDPYERRRKSE